MIIRKTFKVETAHRVCKAYTKRCHGLHGHSYKIEVILKGSFQDDAEMLVDFKLVKEQIGPFIDDFDHSIICSDEDKELIKMLPQLNERYMIVPYNPTAEQMARHIYWFCWNFQLPNGQQFPIHSVRVHETETGYAECLPDDDNLFVDYTKTKYSKALTP